MRSALLAAALLVVLGSAAGAEPAPDPLARAIAESRSADPAVQARAIHRLRDFPEPAAIEALHRILREEPPVPETRERRWSQAARALAHIAHEAPLPPDVLARLEQLAARQPTVMEERSLEHVRFRAPRWDFAKEASRALEAQRSGEIRRGLAREAEALAPERRVAFLSSIAWARRGEDDAARARQWAARGLLREHGREAVTAAARAVPSASDEVQDELMRFLDDLCLPAGALDCLPELVALARAERWPTWELGFDRLARLGTPEAAAAVVEEMRGFHPHDQRRWGIALAALAQLAEPSTLPFLVERLDHPTEGVGAMAARAVARFGPAGKRALLEAGTGPSARVRKAVFAGLHSPAYTEDAEIPFALRLLAPADSRTGEVFVHDADIRKARHHALDAIAEQPDAAALFALARLAERTLPDPAEREETWWRLARAVHAIVGDERARWSPPAVPEELVAFLRAIAASAPQATERRYPYREWALSALFEIDLARARKALPAQAAMAELAWSGARCVEFACLAAREVLLGGAGAGLSATRPWLRRAPPESRVELVAFLRRAYPRDREGVAADLLVLADADEPLVWQAAHAALRELRPEGVAASLVRQLESRDEPARTRAGLETLGALGDVAALPFLERHVVASDEAGSLAAAQALVRLGERGQSWLARALPKLPEPAGRAAARALADDVGPATHEALVRFAAETRDMALQRELLAKLRRAADPDWTWRSGP